VKLAGLTLLFVVLALSAFGCGGASSGGYNMPAANGTETSPPAQQALPSGSATNAGDSSNGGVGACPSICGTLAAYGTDGPSACVAYCNMTPRSALCDFCPSSNVSVNNLAGCLESFAACQAYHCIGSSQSSSLPTGTVVGAGTDAGPGANTETNTETSTPWGTDAGDPDADAGMAWACEPNLPGSLPAFLCVMLNSPACSAPRGSCGNVPFAWAGGPDFYFWGTSCDPMQDAAVSCPILVAYAGYGDAGL